MNRRRCIVCWIGMIVLQQKFLILHTFFAVLLCNSSVQCEGWSALETSCLQVIQTLLLLLAFVQIVLVNCLVEVFHLKGLTILLGCFFFFFTLTFEWCYWDLLSYQLLNWPTWLITKLFVVFLTCTPFFVRLMRVSCSFESFRVVMLYVEMKRKLANLIMDVILDMCFCLFCIMQGRTSPVSRRCARLLKRCTRCPSVCHQRVDWKWSSNESTSGTQKPTRCSWDFKKKNLSFVHQDLLRIIIVL